MIEYILLIGVFVLPIFYRYIFAWNYFFEHKSSITFKKYFNITNLHIFGVLEIFLLIGSLAIFIQSATEIIIFNILFYFGIISSIFVLGKILRKKININYIAKYGFWILLIIFLGILGEISFIFYSDNLIYIYTYLLSVLLFTPFVLFIIGKMFLKTKKNIKKTVILSGGPGLEVEIAKKSSQLFKDYINADFDYYELPKQLNEFIKNKDKYNLAIPVFHGEYGEDGKIFAFLDILGIPHTFSNYATHCLCLDKEKSNVLAFQLGLKVPFQYIAKTSESFPESYPVIMKPNQGGSSFHTYKINNHQEFYDYFNKTRKDLDDKILIQEFVVGDEYSVSIVNSELLPIMKLEKSDDEVFDYESKYVSEKTMKETFPEIEKELSDKLNKQSLQAYNYFNVKSMARVDFIVRDGELYFLEVNTIPGMNEVSILPKAWKLTGRSLEELVKEITKV